MTCRVRRAPTRRSTADRGRRRARADQDLIDTSLDREHENLKSAAVKDFPTERRGSTRFVWAPMVRRQRLGERVVRFMGRKLLDVSDLSIDGIRIPKKGTPRPPRKVTVSLGGRGDVVRQTYEITITRSIPRGNSWVLLTTNGRENSIFEKLVDAIIESRSMVPMPRRSGALLPTVGRPPIACDLESQTCPAHAVSCPQAACTTPSMISGACRGGHGRILNANVVEACLIEERTALLEKFNRTTKALAPTWIEGARG